MKVAVTSASGQLGSAIIKQLVKVLGNDHIIGLARTPTKAQHLGVEVRKGDYTKSADFEEGLKGMDVVVILSGNDDPSKRIGQHRNIIEGAKYNRLKKIVYTSIMGADEGNTFSPIVQSNRQTEEDVRSSGLDWSIGRNGIYIEPDVEYLEHYKKEGEIANCAGEGLCAYTSRDELAVAYTKMATQEKHNGQTYNLLGEPITQAQLASLLNQVFATDIKYREMSVEEYLAERRAELGDFLGTVIGGIYAGIRDGKFNAASHYEAAAGRSHKSALEIIRSLKAD